MTNITPEQLAELFDTVVTGLNYIDEPEQTDVNQSQFTPEELATTTDEHPYLEADDEEYCKACHVVSAIDDVILNALLSEGVIDEDRARVLRILATIRGEYLA